MDKDLTVQASNKLQTVLSKMLKNKNINRNFEYLNIKLRIIKHVYYIYFEKYTKNVFQVDLYAVQLVIQPIESAVSFISTYSKICRYV